MKLIAKHSIKGLKPDGVYTLAGETFETDSASGQRLIDLGAAEESDEKSDDILVGALEGGAGGDAEQEKAAARLALIEKIKAAVDEAELAGLSGEVPADDEELVNAFDQRKEEITEPDH